MMSPEALLLYSLGLKQTLVNHSELLENYYKTGQAYDVVVEPNLPAQCEAAWDA